MAKAPAPRCLEDKEIAHLEMVIDYTYACNYLDWMSGRGDEIPVYDYDHELTDKLAGLISKTPERKNLILCLLVELCALEVEASDSPYGADECAKDVRGILFDMGIAKAAPPSYATRQNILAKICAAKAGLNHLVRALIIESKQLNRELWDRGCFGYSAGENGLEILKTLIKHRKMLIQAFGKTTNVDVDKARLVNLKYALGLLEGLKPKTRGK